MRHVRSRIRLALVASAPLLLFLHPASAQPADSFRACTTPSEGQIAACTALIGSTNQNDMVRGLALVMRANAYRDLADIDRALADYAAALALNPADMNARFNRGLAYHVAREFDRAIADYDQVMVLMRASGEKSDSPQLAVMYRARGDADLAKGDFERAKADYDAALEIIPRLAVALYGRGLARMRLGDAAGGQADVAAAKAIRPDIADVVGPYVK